MVTLFWKLQTVKDLDRPLSEKNCFGTPLDSQHVKGSQNSWNISMRALPSVFFIALREPDLQNISFSDRVYRRGAS